MATVNTLFRKLLNVNTATFTNLRIETSKDGVRSVHMEARVSRRQADRCPICGSKCHGYDQGNARKILDARKEASDIKGSSYAVGKNPENLTDRQRDTLKSIRKSNSRYYRAYEMKESLRLILRGKDRSEAEGKLKSWLWGHPIPE